MYNVLIKPLIFFHSFPELIIFDREFFSKPFHTGKLGLLDFWIFNIVLIDYYLLNFASESQYAFEFVKIYCYSFHFSTFLNYKM